MMATIWAKITTVITCSKLVSLMLNVVEGLCDLELLELAFFTELSSELSLLDPEPDTFNTDKLYLLILKS